MRRYQSLNGTNGNAWPAPFVTGSLGGSATIDIQSNKGRQVTGAIINYASATWASLLIPMQGGMLLTRVTPGAAWTNEAFFQIGFGDGSFGAGGNSPMNSYYCSAGPSTNTLTVGGTITDVSVDGATPNHTFTASTAVWVRFIMSVGANLSVKCWDDGTNEPAGWDAAGIDCNPLGPQGLPLYPYFSVNNGALAAARTFSFDGLVIDDLRNPDPKMLRRALRR